MHCYKKILLKSYSQVLLRLLNSTIETGQMELKADETQMKTQKPYTVKRKSFSTSAFIFNRRCKPREFIYYSGDEIYSFIRSRDRMILADGGGYSHKLPVKFSLRSTEWVLAIIIGRRFIADKTRAYTVCIRVQFVACIAHPRLQRTSAYKRTDSCKLLTDSPLVWPN